MIEKLEIHHLKTLDSLHKSGSISLTAERLGVSQQAISLQLKRIRSILNDQLFIRAGQGVVATPYAKLIEPYINKVLTSFNDIPLPESTSPAQTKRTLTISATDYTQQIIVGYLIRELRVSAPDVKINVINIEATDLIHKIQTGDIDLAFTSHGYVPEGLIYEPLFTEKYLCVSAHNLSPDGVLSLHTLVEHDFIITSPGTGGFKGSADAWFEQQGLQRNVVVSAPSFNIASEYLKQSDLVSFFPSRLLPCDGLFDIPIEKYPPGFEVVAAYHPSAQGDAFMVWLLDKLKDQFC